MALPSRTRVFNLCWMLYATTCLHLWICHLPRERTLRMRKKIWSVRLHLMRFLELVEIVKILEHARRCFKKMYCKKDMEI